MSNIPSFKGLGTGQQLGKVISTADTIGWEDAMRPLIIMGGTDGSTYVLPHQNMEVGNWFMFHIVNDADTTPTRFGPSGGEADVITCDTTGSFFTQSSTREGGALITATVISPQRYSFTQAGGSSELPTVA